MPKALVDSATISQVVQCFDRGETGQYPWSLSTTLSITALAMRLNHLVIAPGIHPVAGVTIDPQNELIDLLLSRGLVGRIRRPLDTKVESALEACKRWIRRGQSIDSVRDEVSTMLDDAENFGPWIDWVSEKALLPHSRQLDGLLDLEFRRYLARILDIEETAVVELHKQSKDEVTLSLLAHRRGSDFELMTRAYLASAIIRGRFHEEIARQDGVQLYSHPLRGLVARMRTRKPSLEFEGSKGYSCLSWLVLYGAMKQRKLSDRLATWVDGVSAINRYLRRGGIELVDGSDRAVIDSAMHVAKSAGVRVSSKRFEDFLDVGAGLGIGVLTAVAVSPWIGVPVGIGAAQILKKLGYPRAAAHRLSFYIDGEHLRQIAAGRLLLEWQSPR